MTFPVKLLRRSRRVLLPALVAASALAPWPAQANQSNHLGAEGGGRVLVRTSSGWVQGKATDQGREFLGIPYAQAPTGALRWRAPKPAPGWVGVKDATRFGNNCPQSAFWIPGYEKDQTAEDCLDANVYTPPATRHTGKLPVMVFIHGGGNVGGAGRDIVPDTFARRTNTVVVTFNYRLGAMGFLTLPGTTGNFALLDQQAAMRWTQANIARFGGDPARVTIAGESAGGGAVCTQLASPTSRGLYRAAIIESGAFFDCAGKSRKDAVSVGLAFAAKLGCTHPATAADCLRAKPAKDILKAQQGTSIFHEWNYTIGGPELPLQPSAAFTAGRASHVPVMNGANSNEGLSFTYDSFDRFGHPLTAGAYPRALVSAFGQTAGSRALAQYPLGAYARPDYAYAAAFGDQLFACPALRTDQRLSPRGRVYTYEFADRTSPLSANLPQHADFDFGATHAAELNYLFKPYGLAAHLNPEQRALSAQMTAYWGSFLHDFVPRAHMQQTMPEQSAHPGYVLQLRTAPAGGNATTANLRAVHHCDLWDTAP
ncbi:carboxylesterase family protein [Streptomyces sp. NPDC007205]|uniref:carboxylesterase/lipase family protein n=1 Tax=Streptomyces sp. NPDC007205 TaxID=3154316 RepID=UPI0033C8DC9B